MFFDLLQAISWLADYRGSGLTEAGILGLRKGETIYSGVCSREDCDEQFWSKYEIARYCSKRCGSWQTGRYVTKRGYIRIRMPDGSYEYEHRLVLAEKLGRPLREGETAHHIDGNRGNNSPENLELWFSQPSGQRARDLIRLVVERYPQAVARELKRIGFKS